MNRIGEDRDDGGAMDAGTTRTRLAGASAAAGGLAWAGYALLRDGGVAEDAATPDAVTHTLGLVAFAVLAVAAVLVLPYVDDHLLSRWGAMVVAAGAAFGVVASIMALTGFALVGGPGFLESGAFALMVPVGTLMVGVGAFRVGGLPRGIALGLFAGGVLALWGSPDGRSALAWAATGLAWLALGTFLLLTAATLRRADPPAAPRAPRR